MEFRVGKFLCSRAAFCSGLSDMYAGKNIKLRSTEIKEICKFIRTRRFPRPRDSLYFSFAVLCKSNQSLTAL